MTAPRYIYGHHAVAQMLEAQPKSVRRVLVQNDSPGRGSALRELAAARRVPVVVIARQHLEKLAQNAVHQGVVAEIDEFAYTELEAVLAQAGRETPLVVVCDSVQDPHNLGSIMRSAYAMGAHGLVIPKDRACEVTPVVMKTAAGAAARLPVARVTNLRRALQTLKDAGLWVVGTAGDAPQELQSLDLRMPLALVVGSEGNGMRHGVTAACDFVAKLPMSRGELGSLNASVAAGIALYEIGRQRALAAGVKASNRP